VSEIQALWLGIVQGVTEFLPVSSSGHLVVFQTLLGVDAAGHLLFDVAVHVATLFAIALFYRRRIALLLRDAFGGRREAWRYAGKLALGTLPAVAVGLTAKDWIEAQFAAPAVSGVGLIATGAILWTTRRTLPDAHAEEPGWRAALLIGCAQAVAILPGISRSGTTVAAALALGIRPLAAAEFSFLLGIIAIAGAATLMLPDAAGMPPGIWPALGVGAAAALASGVAAIWLFLRLLRSQVFYVFSYYVWGVGALFLAWLALTKV
jgi:undecaprenyl-diphosphatase